MTWQADNPGPGPIRANVWCNATHRDGERHTCTSTPGHNCPHMCDCGHQWPNEQADHA